MSKRKLYNHVDGNMVAVKSKFDADIIRFAVNRNEPTLYENLRKILAKRHNIGPNINFLIYYTDPTDGDLLPINNDNNFGRALLAAKPLLRVFITRKPDGVQDINGSGSVKPKNFISNILGGAPSKPKSSMAISNPHDFRQVSAIIDVDIVPETCRRVRLFKHGSNKPLGFYIKDGESYRVLAASAGGGIERVPAVFISRLVPGGLAESTGLLAVNDEVLEVNGIEVSGKTLDQVTDMMIANSSNLIITVKPANQRTALVSPRRGNFSRNNQFSSGSRQSTESTATLSDDDADEIFDLTDVTLLDYSNTNNSRYHYLRNHQHHNFFSHDQAPLHL